MRLVILTGASGSGKTAITEAIAAERPSVAEVLHFDRIGVPPTEDMLAGWGSLEAWQQAMTFEWMARSEEGPSPSRVVRRPVAPGVRAGRLIFGGAYRRAHHPGGPR